MVSGFASCEKLIHYRCGECQKWWSIGDAPPRNFWYCPWCGLKQCISEIEAMESTVEVAATNAMAAADDKVLKDGLLVGSRWQHFKGGIYVVHENVVFEEDCDVLVIYYNEKTPHKKRARRLSVFTGIHPKHQVKRYERIE